MTETPRHMQTVRDRLIEAALPHVPFEGWTARVLREAARDAGFDETMGERAFPSGPVAAVEHFAEMADRRLDSDAQAAKLDELRVVERIAWLVKQRLLPWAEHREAIRRAITLLSLPNHAGTALRLTWRTVDGLWYLAGDSSADFSYYTKRATLAAVYSATLFFWLEDNSDDFEDSWAFLNRRLGDVMAIPKLRREARQRLQHFPNPLALFAGVTRQKRRRFGVRA